MSVIMVYLMNLCSLVIHSIIIIYTLSFPFICATRVVLILPSLYKNIFLIYEKADGGKK
jgi:hypothetical protein